MSIVPVMVSVDMNSPSDELYGPSIGFKDHKEMITLEQYHLEHSALESSVSFLRTGFELLSKGIHKVDISTLKMDIQPLLESMKEYRDRMSYYQNEKQYIEILRDHINEVNGILELYNSKARNAGIKDSLSISFTEYEKGLLFYRKTEADSYLNCYEKNLDLQRRTMYCAKASNIINPFSGFEDFPSFFVYCQVEDVAKVVLFKSIPDNNISFVRLRGDTGPDYFGFYQLQSTRGEKRIWKLDPHLLNVTRQFAEKFTRTAAPIFKHFYKDVFGTNDYIEGFEAKLEEKGLERWKQMKLLYENMQIVCDEYMLGEILRRLVRTTSCLYPREHDCLQSERDVGELPSDFQNVRERWKVGLPGYEEEPEAYLFHCFDKYNRSWKPSSTKDRYYRRWKDFLIQEKYM